MSAILKLKMIFAPHSLREILFSIVSPFITLVQFLLLAAIWPVAVLAWIVFFIACTLQVVTRSAMVYLLLSLRKKYAKFRGRVDNPLSWPVLDDELPDARNVSADAMVKSVFGARDSKGTDTQPILPLLSTEELFEFMQKEEGKKKPL